MKAFYTLENSIQPYAWGSTDGISSFTGIRNPDGKPMAELWMGAHPGAPSMIVTEKGKESLASFIASDPVSALGKDNSARFDGKLPFLFKVLSAGAPLSLQVHPSRKQAVEGFARENAAGIPLSAGVRNYKDDNHKPEIIMAVTPFTAMCGFRGKKQTAALMALLSAPALSEALEILSNNGKYTDFCKALLEMPEAAIASVIRAIHDKAPRIAREHADSATRRAYTLVLKLSSFYPSDIGVLAPLYLNVIDLEVGQAMYLPAGVMHAYIEGTGLELMANSDNVLRGGLTPKHIDVPELLSILDPEPFMPELIAPDAESGIFRYHTESPEFELSRIQANGGKTEYTASAPAILIGGTGEITANAPDGSIMKITKGITVFVPATGSKLTFSGSGTAFIASLPGR